MKKPIVAIMYDFDKTLSTRDMQDYKLIPYLGCTPKEFWNATTEFSNKYGVERILSYMYCILDMAKQKNIKITRELLYNMGKDIVFYPGVLTWFKRINDYGEKHGVKVEHYLISSGTKEIVEGCSIYENFKKAYGCEYFYDPLTNIATWPKLAINYTQKTQFFFRITKGVDAITDDISVNSKTNNLRVEYENVVYIGDGMTDIPCMTLVNKNGGTSIAVYKKSSKTAKKIKKDGRVRFYCEANYEKDSDIENIIKLTIQNIELKYKLSQKEEEIEKKR